MKDFSAKMWRDHPQTTAEHAALNLFLESAKPYIKRREKIGNAKLLSEYARAKGKKRKRLLETLILGNAPLVAKIAHRYGGRGVPIMDLIQEGSLGLWRAITRFDANRKNTLATYATWWVRQAIQRHVEETADIYPFRLPAHAMEKISVIWTATKRLRDRLRRAPTVEEVLAEMQTMDTKFARTLSENLVRKFFLLAYREKKSLNEPTRHADSGEMDSLQEMLAAEQSYTDPEILVAAAELRQRALAKLAEIKTAAAGLKERERIILLGRLNLNGAAEPKTLLQLAWKFGLSRERVRQIEIAALIKLKKIVGLDKTEIMDLFRQIEEYERLADTLKSN